MSEYILEMRNITKEFPGVKALDNVNLQVKKGEIHALIGENGAGKTTLMNVLSGVYPYGTYTGDIIYNGEICTFKDISQSEQKGIVIIHQEMALIPYLSIAENIFLGNETAKNGIINWNECINRTRQLLEKVGLDENPNTLITNLGVGKQQLVEIAKALSKNVQLLILDEPTSALNEQDSQKLLNLIKTLKERGVTSIMISHKLHEILSIADRITILRDGKTVETLDCHSSEITEDRVIKGMVGRELVDRFPKRENVKIGDVIFEIRNWNAYHEQSSERKVVDNVNIKVRAGEVVGIAGLVGSGRTELAMSVFGRSYGKNISGEVYKNGKKINTSTVASAIKNGIAYLSEDRKKYGLVLIGNVKDNVVLTSLDKVSKNSVIDENKEIVVAENTVKRLNVKCTSILQKTMNLSGGNQQKVILGKWIFTDSDIYILDEPTRGIDVGAKYEVYKIINDLVSRGKGVILISSELPEILGMCDRIYVMSEGKIKGEFDREQATQEKIIKLVI
ncbi:MAG TPA: ATP-binding cassette domain-containing protein [Clostridiaceae bacterium]|nr:ATP-binding cassette domain-containing protein [Clostridiaceae bacterium]